MNPAAKKTSSTRVHFSQTPLQERYPIRVARTQSKPASPGAGVSLSEIRAPRADDARHRPPQASVATFPMSLQPNGTTIIRIFAPGSQLKEQPMPLASLSDETHHVDDSDLISPHRSGRDLLLLRVGQRMLLQRRKVISGWSCLVHDLIDRAEQSFTTTTARKKTELQRSPVRTSSRHWRCCCWDAAEGW